MKKIAFSFLFITFLASCVSSPEMTIINAAPSARVTSASAPIAVGFLTTTQAIKGTAIGRSHGGLANIPYSVHRGSVLIGLERKFRIMAHQELADTGYNVLGERHSLLDESDTAIPDGSRFVIRAVIDALNYDTYSSVARLESKASASVSWSLIDVQTGQSVYERRTRAEAEGPYEDFNVIVEAVRGNFLIVLNDASFTAKLL